MTEESHASSPSDGEVTLCVTDDGLLCLGDRGIVDSFIGALQSLSGRSVMDLGAARQSLLDVGAAATTLEALHATSGDYFRMAPDSLSMFKDLGAMPGRPGYFKGTVRRPDGQWQANLDFQQVDFEPSQALSLQLAVATMSLRAAIKDVERAVERVEGKVDDLVARAESASLGEVIGIHRLLAQHVARLDQTGVLPNTMWQSVAALGPQLAIGIEKLRQFLNQRVQNLDPSKPAVERAKRLHDAVQTNKFGQVLQLLIVAEDAHYLWHRLSIEHARSTEPDNLEHVIDAARTLLLDDVRLDEELLGQLRPALEEYATLRPLEKHRVISRDKLAHDVHTLREAFDEFAVARRIQMMEWQEIERPTWADVADELASRANELGRAAHIAGTKVVDATDGLVSRLAAAVAGSGQAAADSAEHHARHGVTEEPAARDVPRTAGPDAEN